ncbi:prepilin-type N-terminal cleavage/methylation domain-containing protein [Geopsychrobacter electrodiphilus]|uniref:prepilin-type N-terminal cleavage/methylation domain-containing protein n=1 Tax=Geopsychrobacter electrodiphilus TaxID=225196 RepID=UPI00037F18E8|nr:prepilin-type N-terminal cleavage/methylation domain-containing protein [Geopsychrobacter electrodiphilus]
MMRTVFRPITAERGFTLIELIVVIVIVGILAVLGGQFIVTPVNQYIDLARRTRLVDQGEMVLRRMQRDVRQALPNSLRIGGGGKYLELLHTSDGGRYRRYLDPVTGGDLLDFTTADVSFDVLGVLRAAPLSGQRLVIYNVSASGVAGNVYANAPDNMAMIGTGSTLNHVILTPAFNFKHKSPYQRFFIVDEPLTYACEGNVLNRYAGYAPTASQPTPPGVTPALVTKNVSSCNFSYDPGASQRAGLVTLRLSLTESGETITLLHQIHVLNAP